MKIKVPDSLSFIKPYVPGKPLEALEREYGITDSIKLASNENPLGPSPRALEAIQNAISGLNRYPDGSGFDLIRKLAKYLGVAPEQLVLGNGSDEIIAMMGRIFLQQDDEVIIPRPSFLMYEIVAHSAGARPVYVPLKSLCIDLNAIQKALTPKTRMIILCNPNNPTGTVIRKTEFDAFLSRIPDNIIVVIDEAYIEFARDPECLKSTGYSGLQNRGITLRTFSKAYGLAGLRVGYGITSPEIADWLNRIRMPFNTSIPAQVGACAALDDADFLEKTIRTVHDGLDFLYQALTEMGVVFFPSQANFFLIDVKKNADVVFEAMLRQGVIIRSMVSYGFPEYIRINAGTPQENRRFIQAFSRVL